MKLPNVSRRPDEASDAPKESKDQTVWQIPETWPQQLRAMGASFARYTRLTEILSCSPGHPYDPSLALVTGVTQSQVLGPERGW